MDLILCDVPSNVGFKYLGAKYCTYYIVLNKHFIPGSYSMGLILYGF